MSEKRIEKRQTLWDLDRRKDSGPPRERAIGHPSPKAVPLEADAAKLESTIIWDETLFAMPATASQKRKSAHEFVNEADSEIASLQAAADCVSGDETQSAAHRLKGAFAMFGLPELASRCDRIEASITDEGWTDTVRLMVLDLAAEYRRTVRSLWDWLQHEADRGNDQVE